MPNATTKFFAGLSRRGHEPLLERMNTELRFDLHEDGRETQQWRLGIRRGYLCVSHGPEDADCVITATRSTFDRIALGETKPLAAWLRNQIAVEGRLQPLIMLERLLPGPPGAHDPRALAEVVIESAQRPGPSR
jgi:hypothetical protein